MGASKASKSPSSGKTVIPFFDGINGVVHLFDGDKGGVGKSFCCATFTQYFLDSGLPFILLEADRYNPDLARRYKGVAEIDFAIFSDDPDKTKADEIIEYAKERQVIISLPSQVGKPLAEWLEDGLPTAIDNRIKFVRWFVVSGSYESFNLLRLSLKQYGSQIQYVVVKNFGFNDDWAPLDAEPDSNINYEQLPEWKPLESVNDEEAELERLVNQRELEAKQIVYFMRKYGVKTIDFPKLPTRERYLLDAYNLTFSRALTSKVFAARSTSLTRIKKFLAEAYTQFESTGLILK
ncbi:MULTISPECIES: P-loop NTPase family protein [Leptolyngbya]|jgi:hypothetical protein|uniref:hypothetical protein n=1 Tax=Leptolyngbya TaxID=47251 RepID=UPI0003613EB2|nr:MULTISPECIES: hypothetical protein [Leptolyngbya]BAS60424.1 hypothetical protein LBWT_Y0120 [Leptolyngbya boryana IAM M-101]BAS66772.1 hypothetical protein LBDG_Y0120 [Leptolyngbya boryana dg5]